MEASHSTNFYGKGQIISAVAGALFAAASVVTALNPSIYLVTTYALPVLCGVGALIAGTVLIALTIHRCSRKEETKPQEEKKEVHFQLSSEIHQKFKEIWFEKRLKIKQDFLESIREKLSTDDYQLICESSGHAFEAMQEFVFEVKDPNLLALIDGGFRLELEGIGQIVQALSTAEKEEPSEVKEFRAYTAIQILCRSLKDKEASEEDCQRFNELLDQIGDINRPFGTYRYNPLMMVALYAAPNIFIEILHQKGADFNHQDLTGNTPLIWAIANANNTTALKIIEIGRGQDFLNTQDGGRENTALILAVAKGYKDKSADGKALAVSNLQLVEALLEAGANPNLKDHHGTSALKVAAIRHDPEMIKILLKTGAQVDFAPTALEYSYEGASHFLEKQSVIYLLDLEQFDASKEAARALLQF